MECFTPVLQCWIAECALTVYLCAAHNRQISANGTGVNVLAEIKGAPYPL